MKPLKLILWFLLGTASLAHALPSFGPTHALINLNRSLQHDSIGFNLPKDLPKFIYAKLIDGSIPLWDNPSKEIRISGEALKGIEHSSHSSFSNISNLFIHEIWELSRRYLDTKTIGFTFINKTGTTSVNFGYVDYQDIAEWLSSNAIPCNANGILNCSFKEAIQNKMFNFSIVQFGDDDFKTNPTLAFDLKTQLFSNAKVKLNTLPSKTPQLKSLSYEVSKEGSALNEAIFKSLSHYFNANLEDYYNLGVHQNVSVYDKSPDVFITKLRITELYSFENGKVTSDLQSIHFFCNGKYLPMHSLDWFRSLNIMVKFKPLDLLLLEKNYQLTLTAINLEEITDLENAMILHKLKTGQWNNLVHKESTDY